MTIILALLLCASAVAGVYLSWRQGRALGWVTALLLLVLSALVFSVTTGWEKGLTYALFLPALFIWLPIFREHTRSPFVVKTVTAKAQDFRLPRILLHTATGLTVLVLQLLFSVIITLALVQGLPMAETGQLALVVVIQPILWAAMIYHYLGRTARLKPLGGQLLVSLLCGLTLVL